MNVTQDLMDWLNGNAKNFSQGTGLLLAPVNDSEPEKLQDNTQEILSTLFSEETQPKENESEIFSEASQETEQENFSQDIHDPEPAPEYNNLLEIPQDFHEAEPEQETPQDIHEQESPQEISQDFHELEPMPETHEPTQEIHNDIPAPFGLSANWKEAAKNTGFVLSLDEPPPEIWTRINAADTDEEEDYEQGTSLQGPAYTPKHGANFTQRLQKTLHDRKARAEERARKEKEASEKNNHPRLKKAALMCSALLLTIALVWVALMFLQTVKISREKIDNVIEIIHDEPTPAPEPETQRQEIIIKLPTPKIKTFDEILNEGNNAFNEKRYNRAIENFFKALELRSNDVRPYIGLAASYRAKGLFIDAKIILDDARKKFGINPTIETEENFLQRE